MCMCVPWKIFFYHLITRTVEFKIRTTAVGKRDHEMNFTAVQRNPFLKEVDSGIDEKSNGILRLEKNCGFTLLCTWMIQFRRYCEPRLTCVRKRSYLRFSIVPRATLFCKWMGRRHFLFLESPDFIQATISRWLFYFHHFIHCESDRARLAALVTMQLCGLARSRQDFKGERARFRAAA